MLSFNEKYTDQPREWLESLFDTVEYGDTGSTLLIIGVLLVVGRVVSGRTPESNRFAKQIAGFSFLLYLTIRVWDGGASLADDPVATAWNGALVAAMVGAMALIAYPALSFLWNGLLRPVQKHLTRLIGGMIAFPHRLSAWLLQPFRHRRALALEKSLQPEREAAERAQQTAEARNRQLEDYRDKLRYDLRLKYRSLQETAAIFDEEQFETMLSTTLHPETKMEIDRRKNSLNELLDSCAKEGLPQDIGGIAAHFQKLRIDLEETSYPDPQKRKLLRWYSMQEEIAVTRFMKGQR